jgi:hypothetical protein
MGLGISCMGRTARPTGAVVIRCHRLSLHDRLLIRMRMGNLPDPVRLVQARTALWHPQPPDHFSLFRHPRSVRVRQDLQMGDLRK